jgi:hypothetical protein
MKEESVKKGFVEAEKSLREKEIEEVKLIVLETLKKIDRLKKDKKSKQSEIKELDEQIKILEADIEDLKIGRIDRIVERQEIDPKAANISVVVIIKEKEIIREPWYQPYYIHHWNIPVYPSNIPITYGGSVFGGSTLGLTTNSNYTNSTFTSSGAKFATIGTYDVGGTIINLR